MKQKLWPIQIATAKQKKKIKRLQHELEALCGGESLSHVSPNLPPEILIEFLQRVVEVEREARAGS